MMNYCSEHSATKTACDECDYLAQRAVRALLREIAIHEKVHLDKKRLARDLDEALHGKEGMASQASFCDLIHPAKLYRETLLKIAGPCEKRWSDPETYCKPECHPCLARMALGLPKMSHNF